MDYDYLYIPTTTLNFNNILSTGSISPAAVYAARQFGYKQFEVVEPNPFRNVILLYDRYPEFVLEDADRDDHPLVLRLRADRLPSKLEKQSGRKNDATVLACAETIYFDPTSADLFFPSGQVQRTALTKSEPSLTTKLVEMFRPFMRVPSPGELDSFTWSGAVLEGIKDGDNATALQCCEADNRINRLKGFASGYVLGAYKSIDPKVARVRSHVRAIRNEVSAMLNDPARKYFNSMRKDIEFSCSTLEQFFAKADIGAQRFDHEKGDNIRIGGGVIADIHDRHETGARSTQSLVQLVNDYCLKCEFFGQLDEERLDVAMDGAKAIRTLVGSQWEGSGYQAYINALLNNIKSGSEFDFESCNSLAMQSFAAFILKGDDLEKLEAFLTAHGIGDFRIAFALWGAMFGFSKLPKTLYNLPSQQGEAAYAVRMHSYIHSVVHGIPLHKLKRPAQVKEKKEEDPATGESQNGEPFRALLSQLQQAVPKSSPWHATIGQLLLASGGLCKGFLTRLKKTKVDDLGGKIKGVSKKDVEMFFKEALESQPSASKGEQLLPLGLPQTGTFWEDATVWDAICGVVPPRSQHRVRDRLVWFQREWQAPNSAYYGWQNEKAKGQIRTKPLDQRTNDEAITAFCRVLERNKDLPGAALDDVRRLLVTRYS